MAQSTACITCLIGMSVTKTNLSPNQLSNLQEKKMLLLLLLHRPLYIFCKRPQTCTQLTNARICGETRDSNTIVSVPC